MTGQQLYSILLTMFRRWTPYELLDPTTKSCFDVAASNAMNMMERNLPSVVHELNIALGRARTEAGEALSRLESYKQNRKQAHDQFERKIEALEYENAKLMRRLGMTEPEPVKVVPVNRYGDSESIWVLRKTKDLPPLQSHQIFCVQPGEELSDFRACLPDPECFMLRHTSFSLMDRLEGSNEIAGLIVKRARLRDSGLS